jgi:hypothetical protein
MMSRGFWLIVVARPGRASRGISGTLRRKGRGECCGYSEVSMWYPLSVKIKDYIVLAPMTSFELCTDHMSGFMGPDEPSSFCNYFAKLHLPTSCGAFTFGGRMRPRANTSSWEQGPDFDLVGTCDWLPYVRAPGSQAYGMLVRFFPCIVYIDSSHRDTLGYEWHLLIAVIS